jgi:hypothetical protein
VAEELVELLIVADGELQVPGDDTRLLVVTGGVTGELEDLGREVWRARKEGSRSATADGGEDATGGWERTLEDGGEVDGGTGTHTLGVVALLQETVDTTDGELESGLGRARRRLLVGLAAGLSALASSSLASRRHC